MADWYVSSAAYAAIPVFAISTAYTVGQIIKPSASTAKNRFTLRCTTAGTTAASEPLWSANNNATTTSGTATFTNVTGQSAYGWAAAAGDNTISICAGNGTNRFFAGDRIFVSSDHAESQSTTPIY